MRQTPGLIVEDRDVLHHRARSGHGAYAPAAGLVVVLLVVVVLGMLGRPAGSSAAGASPSNVETPRAGVATAATPTPPDPGVGTVRPWPGPIHPGTPARSVTLTGAGLQSLSIPLDATPIGLSARGFLFARDAGVFAVDLRTGSTDLVAELDSCFTLGDVGADGDRLLFVEVETPTWADAGLDDCSSRAARSWRLVGYDLATGKRYQLAKGPLGDGPTAHLPVVARDATAYALVIPSPRAGERNAASVEIHPVEFAARQPRVRVIDAPYGIQQLSLAGPTLVMSDGSPREDGSMRMTVELGGTGLELNAPGGPVSVSLDGATIAWWDADGLSGAVLRIVRAAGDSLDIPFEGEPPIAMTAGSDTEGSFVAWATSEQSAIVLVGPSGSLTRVEGVSATWLQLDGSRLCWIENDGSSTRLRVVALSPDAFAVAPSAR